MINSSKLKRLVKKNKLTKEEKLYIHDELVKASKKYYNEGNLIISNEDYDYIYERYLALGGKEIIGAEPDEDSRTTSTVHNYPKLVGTTLKAHNLKEFNEYLDNAWKNLGFAYDKIIKMYATLKFDGNSILIEYDAKGNVLRALTRGKNGKGKDLSYIFKNKKFKINNKFGCDLAIKHECLITYSNLKKLAKDPNFSKKYKNPRNGVAGMLNGNDGDKYIDYYTLYPLWMELSDKKVYKKFDGTQRTIELNFFNEIFDDNATNDYLYTLKGNLEEIKEQMEEVYNDVLSYREDLDFMIDGIVIDFNSDITRRKLGYIENSENPTPKWCIAIKFPYAEKESVVEDIKFSVGDSGKVSPVCYFRPVKMPNGTDHHKQYLQSYMRFKELKLCKGTRILIQLHNDTLSYIERLDTIKDDKKMGRKPIPFTKTCPICGEPLKVIGAFVFCTNDDCTGRAVGKINNFFTKMDIKGIKTNSINKMHEAGLWNTIKDVYTFDAEPAFKIEGLGITSVTKMIKAIENKKYYDYEILGSLGIRNFGIDTAKKLINQIELEDLIDSFDYLSRADKEIAIMEETYTSDELMEDEELGKKYETKLDAFSDTYDDIKEDLIKCEDIAETLAEYIIDGIHDNLDTIRFLMSRGYKKLSDENSYDETRYSFVITGDLDCCSRDIMKKILERHGHKLIGSVSSKTNYLVTNSPQSGTVKLKKAKELGIPIINEKEFLDLLGYDIDKEISYFKPNY